MSTTMELITDQGKLFLKCYKPPSSSDSSLRAELPRVAFAHAVQNLVQERNLPVPRLLPNRVGETYTITNEQIYAICSFVEGRDYHTVELGVALQSAGEVLGRFHQQLHGFEPIIQCQWRLMKAATIEGLRNRLKLTQSVAPKNRTHPVTQEQINQWVEEVETWAVALPVEGDKDWIIHGDFRAQNLKFNHNGHVDAVLDLDTARPASRLFDLAYSLVFFPAVYQDVPLTPHQRSIFRHAYETVVPLSGIERKLLPAHLRLAFLRGMMLWLNLHDFGGMRERTYPWIQGYLNNVETITEF